MKKKMKTRIITAVMAAALTAGMAGCGGGTSQNNTEAPGKAASSDGGGSTGADGGIIELSLWHPMGGVNGETVERIAAGIPCVSGSQRRPCKEAESGISGQ